MGGHYASQTELAPLSAERRLTVSSLFAASEYCWLSVTRERRRINDRMRIFHALAAVLVVLGCGSPNGETGAGGVAGRGLRCNAPADCGLNTVEMTRTCDDGACGHVDHPLGMCPNGLMCDENEFCYRDPAFASKPEMGGVCVPDRCNGGGECLLEDGGIILIET